MTVTKKKDTSYRIRLKTLSYTLVKYNYSHNYIDAYISRLQRLPSAYRRPTLCYNRVQVLSTIWVADFSEFFAAARRPLQVYNTERPLSFTTRWP